MKNHYEKVLKIIGIALLCIVAATIALWIYLSKKPAAPTDYTEKVKTGGAIEETYMALGNYEVSIKEEKVLPGGNNSSHTIRVCLKKDQILILSSSSATAAGHRFPNIRQCLFDSSSLNLDMPEHFRMIVFI